MNSNHDHCCAWHVALSKHIEKRTNKPCDLSNLCEKEMRFWELLLLGFDAKPQKKEMNCMVLRKIYALNFPDGSNILIVPSKADPSVIRRTTLFKDLLESLSNDFRINDIPIGVLRAIGYDRKTENMCRTVLTLKTVNYVI
mmetsp:Transcript_15439/g.22955  ORF Transcript_15439/g.22955 Transcript_15439/m.22955 type:complete len:141 (+) Transcript_15439:54-476(+)